MVDLPGVQLRFAKADMQQAPTRGHVLDHIGFDTNDLPAFIKRVQAEGIGIDDGPRTVRNGSSLIYITDPWGTRIEIVARGPVGPVVQ